jgi:hypothetical protein
MLRESSKIYAEEVNLNVVMTGAYAGDIAGGDVLVAFAEAIVFADEVEIATTRDALVDELGVAAMVDAAGVASNFQRMVRIADSTGITLGGFETITEDIRGDLDINKFASRKAD